MLNSYYRSIGLLAVAWGLSACGLSPVKSNLPLDLSKPGSIAFVIDSHNSSLDTGTINTQTGKNLSDWHYPIATMASASITHRMTVTIGKPERGSTPAGFSFSMGNSDPRALDFQKADVLPITCKLESVQQIAQSAELNMGFADSAVTGANPDIKELTDHVSTVCFNLLKEINWPLPKAVEGATTTSPSWMPEIRIETETEPAVSTTPSQGQSGSSAETPTQATSGHPETSSESQTQPEAASAANPEEKLKAVTKEITKEGRKVYIIHNQGNPIIFKFGHERK